MYEVDSYEYRGLTIKLYPDDSPACPREWCTGGTILTFHRSGEYGEVSINDMDAPDVSINGSEEAIAYWTKQVKEQFGATVAVPVWHYTHSGMTIRTGDTNPFHCPWDSGLMGLIFDTPQGIRDCWGTDNPANKPPSEAAIRSMLEGEIEVYDQWLQGDVYGYVIEDSEGIELDACWGFYGEEDCKARAEEQADWEIKHREEQAVKINRMMAL